MSAAEDLRKGQQQKVERARFGGGNPLHVTRDNSAGIDANTNSAFVDSDNSATIDSDQNLYLQDPTRQPQTPPPAKRNRAAGKLEKPFKDPDYGDPEKGKFDIQQGDFIEFLMKDVVKTYGGLAFRHFVLSSHYRAPAIFSDKSLLDSQKKVQQWESSLKKAYIKLALNDLEIPDVEMNEKVLSYLLDDLNTPNAITEIYEDNKILNNVLRQKEVDLKALQQASGVLKKDLEVLGFNFAYPVISLSDKKLFSEYYKAKDEKDFVQSDKLRQILIDKGLF